MSADLNSEPNYQELVEALIQKTISEKVKWNLTADETTFVSSVKGQLSFEIQAVPEIQFPLFSVQTRNTERDDKYLLKVRDASGKVMFKISSSKYPQLSNLFGLAFRVANNIDEKVESTVRILSLL